MTGRAGPAIRVRTPAELRTLRRRRAHRCWGHLIAAPLWPQHGANLGTLLRTCDAVGACLAVPPFRWVPEAPARGNTLRRPVCTHRVGDPLGWLTAERAAGAVVVGVEVRRVRRIITGNPTPQTTTGRVVGAPGYPQVSGHPSALPDAAWMRRLAPS